MIFFILLFYFQTPHAIFDTNQNNHILEENRDILDSQNTSSQESKKTKKEEDFSKKFSIDLKSSMSLKNNSLLKTPNNYSVSIPYTEIEFKYEITKKLFLESEFEFFYKKQNKKFNLDNFFLEYVENSFLVPFLFRWGYFRADYIESNKTLFNKKTLVHQQLFPYGDKALGLLLQTDLTAYLSLIFNLQNQNYKRETDGFYSLKLFPIFSSYLIYNKNKQKAFIAYFQQEYFLKDSMSSLGIGTQLQMDYKDYTFKLKAEAWKIRKKPIESNLMSYYLFPYLKWNFLGVGYLIGAFYEKTLHNKTSQFESLAKLDLYFTKNSYFSIEKIKEFSTVYKQNSWNFSIKTHFKIN
ncbi:MAG: hypothetical protein GDA46_02930 [Bdellovibrionales bacterium]|nr:hypothetical protein [Bdellovibrionales bacterium]